MALKGLVRFFAIMLILISVWQLSFTWIVNSFERKQKARAEKFVKNNFGTASKETKDSATNAVYRRYIDSLKEKEILDVPVLFPKLTYQKATEQELNLGLDLQGGMNVTLEVGLDGLIRSMSNNPKDVVLNKALASAIELKKNSDDDFVTLFGTAFNKESSNGRLAPLFAGGKNKTIKIDASNSSVLDAIRVEARDAIKRTYDRLTARIDQFGVAQPNISYDENKGIITVELAGIDDPERVRKFLQATANLEFWDTYSNADPIVGQSIAQLDQKVKAYLSGSTDTTAADTNAIAKADTSAVPGVNNNPVSSLYLPNPADGSARLGMIRISDTALFSKYVNLEVAKNSIPATMRFMYSAKSEAKNKSGESMLTIYIIKTVAGTDEPKLTGEYITDARQDFDQRNNEVEVQMEMNSRGASIWEKMTGDAFNGKYPIAIALDNYVYSAPGVNNGAISGGVSQISGSFTIQEAQDLSSVLRTGKLPAPARIVQEQVVGPTLGAEAIKGGSLSFIISFIIIFILMLVYYNTGGWIANIALILNLLFTVGILSAFGATLTAAGIAGLVLTIGMAVDTNVIIFERIKEELTKGKSYQIAIEDGYRRSLAPVLDGHITTLLTSFILLYFGLGPVKGFATTQIIGILLSLFCGILVSRLITDMWTNKKRHFEYFTAVSRKIFAHAAYKFIEFRKYTYMISAVVLVLGLGTLINGFDYGVEFRGGRSYTVKFDRELKNEEVANELNKVFGKYPIIKTVGTARQLNITTDYMIDQPGETIDAQVETKLYEGLKTFLPAGTSYEQFKTAFKQSSQTVQPTISDDLKKGALWATILGLLVITLYIFIRFRDWRYSIGTIVALLHDVLVTLIVFSFLRNIVPFPLEIDQHFIAAILTVIGFSMNDTVVVFDRVREYSVKMFGQPKGVILNKAINDTLARTVMTSLTVFLTLLTLFIFGGEVTRGFAFAMLIGVITGVYSSVFVAAPILMDFAKDKPLGEPEKDKTLAKARHSIS